MQSTLSPYSCRECNIHQPSSWRRTPFCHCRTAADVPTWGHWHTALRRVNLGPGGRGNCCQEPRIGDVRMPWAPRQKGTAMSNDVLSSPLLAAPRAHRLSPQGKERLPSSGVTATSCNLSSGARHAATSFCKFIRENTCPYHRRQLFSGRHVVKTGPKFRCCFITFYWI